MAVIEIILPVFLVVGLGAVLCRTGFLSEEFIGGLNRLVYWVGLPVFLFGSISGATFSGGRSVLVAGVLIAVTLLGTALAYAVAKLVRMPWQVVGTFVQSAIRGNLAYIGLPVVALAVDQLGGEAAANMKTLAVLAVAPTIIVFNIISVTALVASEHRLTLSSLRPIFVGLITNPLIIASVGGVLVAASGIHQPVWWQQTLFMVGQMALPVALLCIGGALVLMPLRGRRRTSMLSTLLKTCVLPVIGFFLGRWAGLDADELRIALIFLATPTAAASYTQAGKMGGDEALAASTVVFSTAFSILSLAAVLALT